ncbi:MAG: hypothetical protein WCP77_15405 [Roseococcus sp.]
MSTTTLRPGLSVPFWFWLLAGLGLAWNLFGMMRFLDTAFATPEALVAGGMTPDQALFYAALPLWLNLAFGIGVGGGVLGCALLLLRRSAAVPVLVVSLGAYLVLYAGDITEGVFAAFGMAQVVILSLVVLIAAGLL